MLVTRDYGLPETDPGGAAQFGRRDEEHVGTQWVRGIHGEAFQEAV